MSADKSMVGSEIVMRLRIVKVRRDGLYEVSTNGGSSVMVMSPEEWEAMKKESGDEHPPTNR